MIVEFEVAVFVGDEAVSCGAECACPVAVGNGCVIGRRTSVLELREEGIAVEVARFFEAGEIAEGGEEVDGLGHGFRNYTGFFDLGGDDDERRTE